MRLIKIVVAIFLVTIVGHFPAKGQVTKRNLRSDEYHKWETLSIPEASPDGGYVAYSTTRGDGTTRFFVQALKEDQLRSYTGISKPHFLSFKNRVAYQKGDTLVVETNAGGPVRTIHDVRRFEPLWKDQFLLTCPIDFHADTTKCFTVVDSDRWTTQTFCDVLTYAISPTKRNIAFSIHKSGHSQIVVYNMHKENVQRLDLPAEYAVNTLNWSADGESLTFLWKGQGDNPYAQEIGYVLDVANLADWNRISLMDVQNWKDVQFARNPQPILSADKTQIFLEVNLANVEATDDRETKVEIWRPRAHPIFPYINAPHRPRNRPKLGSVTIAGSRFNLVQEQEETLVARNLDDRFAVKLDFSPYEPAYLYQGSRYDINLLDLSTYKSIRLDSAIIGNGRTPFFVDKLNSLIYPDGDRLIMYRLATGDRTIINRNIPTKRTDCRACFNGVALSSDARYLYLLDEFDMWEVNVTNLEARRLTFGRDQGIEYRFAKPFYTAPMFQVLEIDLEDGIFLQAENKRSRETGYFRWTNKRGVEKIVFGNRKHTFLTVLGKQNGYLYKQEAFDQSPSLMWKPSGAKPASTIAKTNLHQSEYHWGKSEMVYYHTAPDYMSSTGRQQNGALFYPANYQEGKKYPLIVSIYEDNTYMLNEYHKPGPSSFLDFNATDYTLDGYFVLNPNLRPRDASNPAHSMLENLKAAVDYMKSTGMIDENRIGIYGHSFGGYEALFAATQMEDFATVVAGAAITDVVTDYFSYRDLLDGPSFYRTDWMQKAMKRSYFEIPELYHANSPFHQMARVKAPILLWTGKEDTNVGWEQSVQFYMGMLRLQKECTLLVYPGENHVIFDPGNLVDLDVRMKQWFGHHLKGEAKQEWMM